MSIDCNNGTKETERYNRTWSDTFKHVDNNEMIKRGTDNISKIIVLPILINKAKRGFVMNGSSKWTNRIVVL